MTDPFWEEAARKDPLWAILSDPVRRNRGWNIQDFFDTGRREISLLLHQLASLGFPPRRGAALDFGCGVGRLTQALAPAFDEVTGVDVSPTMVRLANLLNRWPGKARYLLNSDSNLSLLPSESLDFIYSDVVLQHIPAEQARRYLVEFLRVLRPGGVVAFQLTAERRPDTEVVSRVESMPDGAYAARIEVVGGFEKSMPAGAMSQLVVTVGNRSSVVWEQARYGVMRVGNHWLSPSGPMLIQDDGRTLFDAVVSPGEERQVGLTIRSPGETGMYVCEVDLVHEGVTWFADRGSETFRGLVRVGADAFPEEAASAAPGPLPRADYPDIYAELSQESTDIGAFPMYGVPRIEVLTLMTAAGGRCFHVEPDERGGPEWLGYRYFVIKPSAT
jgi:SAM-dependent methyltransferase